MSLVKICVNKNHCKNVDLFCYCFKINSFCSHSILFLLFISYVLLTLLVLDIPHNLENYCTVAAK
jgi:hypothetical protein